MFVNVRFYVLSKMINSLKITTNYKKIKENAVRKLDIILLEFKYKVKTLK